MAVDDYVVAIAAPLGVRSSEGGHPKTAYMYLIHPKTEKVWLTWKERLQ